MAANWITAFSGYGTASGAALLSNRFKMNRGAHITGVCRWEINLPAGRNMWAGIYRLPTSGMNNSVPVVTVRVPNQGGGYTGWTSAPISPPLEVKKNEEYLVVASHEGLNLRATCASAISFATTDVAEYGNGWTFLNSEPAMGSIINWEYVQNAPACPASFLYEELSVTVAVTPSSVTVNSGETANFVAEVTGTSNTGVTWSALYGEIDSLGVYHAPAVASVTYDVVTATSIADPGVSGTAAVTVRPIVEPPEPGERPYWLDHPKVPRYKARHQSYQKLLDQCQAIAGNSIASQKRRINCANKEAGIERIKIQNRRSNNGRTTARTEAAGTK